MVAEGETLCRGRSGQLCISLSAGKGRGFPQSWSLSGGTHFSGCSVGEAPFSFLPQFTHSEHTRTSPLAILPSVGKFCSYRPDCAQQGLCFHQGGGLGSGPVPLRGVSPAMFVVLSSQASPEPRPLYWLTDLLRGVQRSSGYFDPFK